MFILTSSTHAGLLSGQACPRLRYKTSTFAVSLATISPTTLLPTAYLTWKACQHTPEIMTNDQLIGLDWDTITGLFDRVGTVKTMHVDTPMVTGSWAARADYDPFCPSGTVLHNHALALFLSPNTEPSIELDHPELRDYVFSAVVVFKPASQNTCNLITGVNRLLEFCDKGGSSMALISLSD